MQDAKFGKYHPKKKVYFAGYHRRRELEFEPAIPFSIQRWLVTRLAQVVDGQSSSRKNRRGLGIARSSQIRRRWLHLDSLSLYSLESECQIQNQSHQTKKTN